MRDLAIHVTDRPGEIARVANALNRLADRWAPGPIAVVAISASAAIV